MTISQAIQKINRLNLDEALCQRAVSIEIAPSGVGTELIAWQCNMAGMKNADLRLPTVLRIALDPENRVADAELAENFKGSQGIPCSRSYLDRILKRQLLGIDFLKDDTVLRNELQFHCRHTFELAAAALTFFRYCREQPAEEKVLFDLTRAFPDEKGLRVRESYTVGENRLSADLRLIFGSGDILMQADGKIAGIRRLEMEGELYREDRKLFSFSDGIADVSGSELAVMNMMKLFSGVWKTIGKEVGIRRNFYFSNLVPSSLYGVLMQAVALMLFPNNYNYFQHALAGLQRAGGKPLCVGMVENPEEIEKYYPELKEEDLYG